MRFIFLIILFFNVLTLFSQNNSRIEQLLLETYPDYITNDKEWVFEKDSALIELIDEPFLKTYLSQFKVYAVNLTWKTRTDWLCRCLVFYDSSKNTFLLQPPISMSGANLDLIKIIEQIDFKIKDTANVFLEKFHLLKQVGSKCKYFLTDFSEPLSRFEIVYFNDQNFVVKPYQETISTVYEKKQIQGVLYVTIIDGKIVEYKELSPKERGEFSAICTKIK